MSNTAGILEESSGEYFKLGTTQLVVVLQEGKVQKNLLTFPDAHCSCRSGRRARLVKLELLPRHSIGVAGQWTKNVFQLNLINTSVAPSTQSLQA